MASLPTPPRLGLSGRLQRHAGIQVDGAVGVEPRSGSLHDDMAGEAAIEVLGDDVADPTVDAGPEGVTHLHLFSRYAQAHLETDLPVHIANGTEFIPVTGGHKVYGDRAAEFQTLACVW